MRRDREKKIIETENKRKREKMFPKQYPQWRPPAQWSKTVGKLAKKEKERKRHWGEIERKNHRDRE